jgi:branched-chain amino acid transport system ATP-binding protein
MNDNESAQAQVALNVVDVTKRFGGFTALNGVSLTVREGELHAVIGPNGAGKTTLFDIVTGQLRPTSGTVEMGGRKLNHASVHERVKFGLARSFQVTSLFQELTAFENVRLAAQGKSVGHARQFWGNVSWNDDIVERTHEVIDEVGLHRVAGRRASELSHGQQRLVEVAMALAPHPKILLLDEPTSGVGVDDIPMMERLLSKLVGPYTILMIEHNMSVTMKTANRISVLMAGEIIAHGDPSDIRNDERVKRAYLGQGRAQSA